MATKYFKKLNTANVLQDRAGAAIVFEPIADRDRTGILAVEESNTNVFDALEGYANERVGGVIRISAEIFDELKKKEPELSVSSPLSRLRLSKAPQPFQRSPEAVVAPSAVVADAKRRETPIGASTFFARTRRASAEAAQNNPNPE